LEQTQVENLINNGILKVDLPLFEKDIPFVLEALSKQYTPFLSNRFSANEDYFSEAKFQALSTGYQANYQNRHIASQLSIGRKDVLKVLKDQDSLMLELILLAGDLPASMECKIYFAALLECKIYFASVPNLFCFLFQIYFASVQIDNDPFFGNAPIVKLNRKKSIER